MAESMTSTTGKSVGEFLAQVEDEVKRKDSHVLVEMMSRITGEEPKMWGDSIVGFGRYHYKYDSGHEGDTALIGFSPRKSALSIYLTGTYFPEQDNARQKLLDKLGKHTIGKACLYVKRLEQVDLKVLEALMEMSVSALRKHYPDK